MVEYPRPDVPAHQAAADYHLADCLNQVAWPVVLWDDCHPADPGSHRGHPPTADVAMGADARCLALAE